MSSSCINILLFQRNAKNTIAYAAMRNVCVREVTRCVYCWMNLNNIYDLIFQCVCPLILLYIMVGLTYQPGWLWWHHRVHAAIPAAIGQLRCSFCRSQLRRREIVLFLNHILTFVLSYFVMSIVYTQIFYRDEYNHSLQTQGLALKFIKVYQRQTQFNVFILHIF